MHALKVLAAAALPAVLGAPPPAYPLPSTSAGCGAPPPAYPTSSTPVGWGGPPPAYPTSSTSNGWGAPPPAYPTSSVWSAPPPTYPTTVTSAQSPLYSAVHAAECLAVDAIVDVLDLLATPTQFCSSYLGIRPATSISTSTCTDVVPTTSTSYVSTATVTQDSTATTTVTSTITTFTSTSTDISTVTVGTSTANPVTATFCNGAPVAPANRKKRNAEGAMVQATPIVSQRGLPLLGPLLGFPSSQVSTACLCLNIPTPTHTSYVSVTTTSTSTSVLSLTSTTTTTAVVATSTSTAVSTVESVSTVTATSSVTATVTPTTTVQSCPAPTLCGNQGLQFAVYPNNDGQNSGSGYPSFNPQGYKTKTPVCTGTTSSLGGFNYPSVQAIDIYGQCPLGRSNYFTINHRGYIFAQKTGKYTFTVTKVDDILELWVGNIAYSGWTRANAVIDNSFQQPTASYVAQFTAGTYYPIRIVYGQAQGAASFQMTVTAPDGTTFLGPNTPSSPYLVQRSCDGTTAPAFAPFGSET